MMFESRGDFAHREIRHASTGLELRHDRAISCYLRCALPYDWSAVAHSNPQLAELEK